MASCRVNLCLARWRSYCVGHVLATTGPLFAAVQLLRCALASAIAFLPYHELMHTLPALWEFATDRTKCSLSLLKLFRVEGQPRNQECKQASGMNLLCVELLFAFSWTGSQKNRHLCRGPCVGSAIVAPSASASCGTRGQSSWSQVSIGNLPDRLLCTRSPFGAHLRKFTFWWSISRPNRKILCKRRVNEFGYL